MPALLPESAEFRAMPSVLATGYMVGLFEWACIELLRPHLDPGEGSLGTQVDFSHIAATPPGFTLEVTATLTRVDGRSLYFDVRGHDGADRIGEGTHRRAIVTWQRFEARLAEKERGRLERSRDGKGAPGAADGTRPDPIGLERKREFHGSKPMALDRLIYRFATVSGDAFAL